MFHNGYYNNAAPSYSPYPQQFWGPPPEIISTSPYASYYPPFNLASNRKYHPATQYIRLNTLLAADVTTLGYDLRVPPSQNIDSQVYMHHRYIPATTTQDNHVRLISRVFPWQIDVKITTPVTCEMIWDGLYRALQQPIADSEWALLVGDDIRKRDAILKAAAKRAGSSARVQDKAPRRIDWLGEKTIFRGLMVDEEFAKVRVFPGTGKVTETYAVILESS